MDPKDQKIAELTKQVSDLNAAKTTLETEVTKLKEDNTKLGEDITKKDEVITQKNNDIIGVRKLLQKEKGLPKMSEMTQEQLDKMTETEKTLAIQQEEFARKQEEFAKSQDDLKKKEIESRKSEAIRRFAGKDPELAKKVADNFNRIKDADQAYTPEEISKVVQEAFNMTGAARVSPTNPVANVVQQSGGGDVPDGEAKDFTDTTEGKGLAGLLNLNIK